MAEESEGGKLTGRASCDLEKGDAAPNRFDEMRILREREEKRRRGGRREKREEEEKRRRGGEEKRGEERRGEEERTWRR